MRYVIILFLLLFLSCHSNSETDPIILLQNAYFESIRPNDIKLETPQKGEWLYDHKEPGQTFEQYKKSNPVRLTKNQYIIYLKPIGEFNKLQTDLLDSTTEYLKIYFQQDVILMQPISDTLIPKFARRRRDNGSEQILASYILDSVLKDKIPMKGIVLMAISAKDLFPKSDWNYIFGLASYNDRVGVTSIFRLENGLLNSETFKLCLTRVINICAHEVGHMFSIHHCTNAKCVMNGSNSLYETDEIPNRLCSECQRKMYWNFHYDNEKRLKELNRFFQDNEMERDYNLSKSDLNKME